MARKQWAVFYVSGNCWPSWERALGPMARGRAVELAHNLNAECPGAQLCDMPGECYQPVLLPADPWRIAAGDIDDRIGTRGLRGELPEGFLKTWGWGAAQDEGYTPDEAVSMVWDGTEVIR